MFPEALGTEGEEKKGQKCFWETCTVKLKRAKALKQEGRVILSFDADEY